MADFGTKISKPGYSITDGNNRLILHSKYPLQKIAFAGLSSMSVNTTDVLVQKVLTHNLGYVPQFSVLMQSYGFDRLKDSQYRKPAFSQYHGTQFYTYYRAYANTTQLIIEFSQNGAMDANATLNILYAIYYDEQP